VCSSLTWRESRDREWSRRRAVAGECPAEPSGSWLIGPLHEAIGTDGDDRVLHAVEPGFELALAGLDGGELSSTRRAVLRWRRRRDRFRPAKVPGCEPGDRPRNAAATSTMRSRRRALHWEAPRPQSARKEMLCRRRVRACGDLRGDGLDIGERIGQRTAPPETGTANIKERNAPGGCGVHRCRFCFERSDEFRTRRMVFHAGGLTRNRQDFARGIDDGDASAGGLASGGNVGEGVTSVGFRRGERGAASSG